MEYFSQEAPMNSLTKPPFLLTWVMPARLISFVTITVLACLPSDGLAIQICPFRQLTGIPCPFCGIMRSLSSCLHLELTKGVGYHPLGPLVLVCLLSVMWSGGLDVKVARKSLNLNSNRVQIALLGLFIATWIVRLTILAGDS